MGELAKLFVKAAVIALTAFISPFQSDRENARSLVPHGVFWRFIAAARWRCASSAKLKFFISARVGETKDFTGISSPYEVPVDPELVVDTGTLTMEKSVARVMLLIRQPIVEP